MGLSWLLVLLLTPSVPFAQVCYSAPLPNTRVTRQPFPWTISGPAQPLVSCAGPPPGPAVGERPVVYRSANGRWSSGPRVESEVRGGSGLLPGALQPTQRVAGGCVLMVPERGRAQALRRW